MADINDIVSWKFIGSPFDFFCPFTFLIFEEKPFVPQKTCRQTTKSFCLSGSGIVSTNAARRSNKRVFMIAAKTYHPFQETLFGPKTLSIANLSKWSCTCYCKSGKSKIWYKRTYTNFSSNQHILHQCNTGLCSPKMYSMKAIASFEKHKGHTSFAYRVNGNLFGLGVFWNKVPCLDPCILYWNSQMKTYGFTQANVALAPQETTVSDYFLDFLPLRFSFPVPLESPGCGATGGLEPDDSLTPGKPASRAFFIE